jgi:GTPase Era involved in 16S rRNA processing
MSRNPSSIFDQECLRDPKEPTTIQELPHAVIFVVPANQRRVPEELEEFVNLFTEFGYKPMFAVTKIDCHGGQKVRDHKESLTSLKGFDFLFLISKVTSMQQLTDTILKRKN